MTQDDKGLSIIDSWAEDPVAAVVAAAAGAVAGAAVASLMLKAESLRSDEPPIRVRHGSLRVQLLDSVREFADEGSNKKWKIKGDPARSRDEYFVLVLPSDLSTCPYGIATVGTSISIHYADGQEVRFKSAGRRTKIRSKNDLAPAGYRDLTYSATGGYITQIDIDSMAPFCKLTSFDPALQVVLLDI